MLLWNEPPPAPPPAPPTTLDDVADFCRRTSGQYVRAHGQVRFCQLEQEARDHGAGADDLAVIGRVMASRDGFVLAWCCSPDDRMRGNPS